MMINLRAVTGKPEPANTGPRALRRLETQTGARQSDGDSLALTDAAARLKEAEQALSRAEVIDMARVTRVANALQDGSYQIDAEQIAEKLLELDSQLP
ncbi:negative regulator of flagellin synthesis FlgM [Methylomarinovum caldicuralii]|uniref:Negative regulator of flagellin synthesis n=1 Tax=Methylomarinovum caldicuralii TaxID=438856 RepID=A0AAU9BVV0_9GAMM|nr:flagellar biosynthesis anti-sigma factor FlgM [Methylomarinovum caldicuralii]BCX82916.1 negative regulator of flagellin synthesis FlgM [Methylomarinovum caldicuralii]